jgi:hypothetical protein
MKHETEPDIPSSAPPVPWRTRLRCFLFGHTAKDYCETVMHYEVLCRQCGATMTRIPPLVQEKKARR